jgi:hypothetical protein
VAVASGIRSPIEIFSSLLTKKKSNWGTGHVMTETPGVKFHLSLGGFLYLSGRATAG